MAIDSPIVADTVLAEQTTSQTQEFKMSLKIYDNGTLLVTAYQFALMVGGIDREIALMMAKAKMSYVPHLWNGGYMIRGFGACRERGTDWKAARA